MAMENQRKNKNQYEYSVAYIRNDLILPVVSKFFFVCKMKRVEKNEAIKKIHQK